MTVAVRTPTITASWLSGTTTVAFTRVLEARTTWGLDLAVSEASFSVPEIADLHGATYFSYVSITLHGGAVSPPTWKGFITSIEYTLYPRTVTVHCHGPLILAQLQEMPTYSAGAGTGSTGTGHDTIGGYLLVPADLSVTDDATIVNFVLSECSADTFLGSLGGTTRVLGTFSTAPFRWSEGETALSVIQRIDEMSAQLSGGVWKLYRTYDDYGGSINRLPIDTVPSGSPALTFTEGVDISAGQDQKDILASKNRIVVTGLDRGDGTGAVNYTVIMSNAFLTQESHLTLQLSNPMLEVQREADVVSNKGLSCEGVANALIRQWSPTQERVTLTTPLDVAPPLGGNVAIAAPVRFGTTLDHWVQRVERSIGQDGTFGVDLTIVRGAS
jgi:hypothetical protein